jgi:hypothetical protein
MKQINEKVNPVDRVYRLVDSARSRFAVVSRWRSCEGSSERLLPGDSGHGGSPRLQQKGRGDPAGPHR